ncbi:MAG: UDP-N-acetylmuramoyl-L-alanyl-D-glutamate--2,6-diaminopimelate ligase [Alkalibacterium sp.]
MKWSKLTRKISYLDASAVPETMDIKGITDQSDKIEEGFIFVAIKGYKVDGHTYISEAVDNGASVIIGEQESACAGAPYIQVDNSRKTLGELAASFYGYPAKNKLVIGVTGTNGKTTTGLFLRHLFKNLGYRVAFFGTVFNEMNGQRYESTLTTPSASMIQKALAESTDDVVVIEVSSQGLAQHRMEGMSFDYALFTNLQHDHLDYHKSMEAYFFAKKKLFSLLKDSGKAVVNEDSEWGERLTRLLEEEGKTVITVGETDQSTHYHLESSFSGKCVMNDHTYEIKLPLPGKYNLANLSLALTVLNDLGHDLTDLSALLKKLDPMPGRFEGYNLSDKVYGIIDYAHTAEALQALLPTIKELYAQYKLVHVFGFRGNRDSTKRDKMVDISTHYSDETILTLDDLNGVSIEDMQRDYISQQDRKSQKQLRVILDRTRAINEVVESATVPTLIVVSGKGHEPYKETFELPSNSDKETFQLLTASKSINNI